MLALLSLVKLLGVQTGDGRELAERAEEKRTREVDLLPQRGSILDRNGVELAISVPRVRVATGMPALRDEGIEDAADLERFARDLAPVLGVDADELAGRLADSEPDDPWVPLAWAVTEQAARRAEELLDAQGLEDVLVQEPASERVHPAGESALRLIGRLQADGVPSDRAGIEWTYDEVLRGRKGEKVVEIGRGGQTIAGGERMISRPVEGSHVRLTLDRTFQHQVEAIVADGTERAGGVRGIAVVGDPSTGEILAAVGVERDAETGAVELADGPIALSNAYQAGSVFKLVTIAAAVEAGQVGPDTQLEVPWKIEVDDREFEDSHEHETEMMSVSRILADSSNVGTIRIAQGLGKQRLHDALVRFGFGVDTGLGHPAESDGLLPPVEDWTDPDLAASSIGTHQTATAVQLWAAYNVIANRGRYVPPRLVDSIIRPDGTRTRVEQGDTRQVISRGSAAAVSRMLRQVVREGTGKALDLPGYSVAAKTGTSRLLSPEPFHPVDAYLWPDGRYHHVAAFTGFFPVERPEVSITVLIEDVAPEMTGATAAGPVFAELSQLAIRELGIAPAGGSGRLADNRVRAAPAAVAEATVETDPGTADGPADGTAT